MSVRRQFTRYRRGVPGTAPTVGPGWLDIYNRAIGPVPSISNVRSSSGQIDFGRGVSLYRGDILKDTNSSRLYFIIQLQERPSGVRAIVAELFAPIPDELECGIIEAWWTDAGVGTWAMDATSAELGVSGAGLTSNNELGIPFLYQTVSGDFDVYAKVKTSAGSGLVARYVGIKAGSSNDLSAAFVGIKNNGSAAFHFAQRTASTNASAAGSAYGNDLYGWVRLKRAGCRFAGYYSIAAKIPARDADWVEIPDANVWLTFDDVRLGFAAYCDGTLGMPTILFKSMRNWITT